MCNFKAFTASFFLGHQTSIFIYLIAHMLSENGMISFGLITPVFKVILKKKKAFKSGPACSNLWVLRVLGQGLKSECADILHQSYLWLLRHTDEPQKGRNSCLWLQSRSVLSSFGVLLMSCRVKFHVVRSALQYSACRILYIYIYFCWSGLYRSYVLRHSRLRSIYIAVPCG